MDFTRDDHDRYSEVWKFVYERARDEPIYYAVVQLRGRIPDGECLVKLLQALQNEKDVLWNQVRNYQMFYPNPSIMKAPDETRSNET